MSNIERIKCGNGNAYLVSDGDNTVLVDTGRAKYRDMVLQKCKAKNVRAILLTHGHADHVQNAAFLSKALRIPIAMHRDDYELIKDNWSEPMFAHMLLGKIIVRLSRRSFETDRIEAFEPTFVKDGDSLGAYGVSAVILGLPGHTKGSIGVKVGETDLIVGDALMNMVYPTKSPLYGNRAMMEQSAARIRSLGDVRIHFGHGRSVKNRKW